MHCYAFLGSFTSQGEWLVSFYLISLTSKVNRRRGEERKNIYIMERAYPFRQPPERQASQSLSSYFYMVKLEIYIQVYWVRNFYSLSSALVSVERCLIMSHQSNQLPFSSSSESPCIMRWHLPSDVNCQTTSYRLSSFTFLHVILYISSFLHHPTIKTLKSIVNQTRGDLYKLYSLIFYKFAVKVTRFGTLSYVLTPLFYLKGYFNSLVMQQFKTMFVLKHISIPILVPKHTSHHLLASTKLLVMLFSLYSPLGSTLVE